MSAACIRLSYPQTEDVSPEFWKTRLQEAILTILSKLAEKAPTVFFIEDLHWADPSFVELLRRACVEIRSPRFCCALIGQLSACLPATS